MRIATSEFEFHIYYFVFFYFCFLFLRDVDFLIYITYCKKQNMIQKAVRQQTIARSEYKTTEQMETQPNTYLPILWKPIDAVLFIETSFWS